MKRFLFVALVLVPCLVWANCDDIEHSIADTDRAIKEHTAIVTGSNDGSYEAQREQSKAKEKLTWLLELRGKLVGQLQECRQTPTTSTPARATQQRPPETQPSTAGKAKGPLPPGYKPQTGSSVPTPIKDWKPNN